MKTLLFFIFLIKLKVSYSVDYNTLLRYASDLGTSLLTNPRLVFPGTEWCGGGHIARSNEDLGPFNETDACCRNHDLCPDIIKAQQSNHGLTNHTLYTRLNCQCDNDFRDCLHRANTPIADITGIAYFDILKSQCFANTYPATCTKRGLDLRCTEYSYDTSAEPEYQWFDIAPYK